MRLYLLGTFFFGAALAQGVCDPNTTACGDICCSDNIAGCCVDEKHGDICCIKELTFCCPPQGRHASRCCPRWYICCDDPNSFDGCCDPSTIRSPSRGRFVKKINNFASTSWPAYVEATGLLTETPILSGNTNLHSLFLPNTLASGRYNDKVDSRFNTWGESVRPFSYASSLESFVLMQADNVVSARPVALYLVASKTGEVTKHSLTTSAGQSVTGEVLSFSYVEATNVVLFSTPQRPASPTNTSFFWQVSLSSLKPTSAMAGGLTATHNSSTSAPTSLEVELLGVTSEEEMFDGFFATVDYHPPTRMYAAIRIGAKNPSTGGGGFGAAVISVPATPPSSPLAKPLAVGWVAVHVPSTFSELRRGYALYNPSSSNIDIWSLAVASAEESYVFHVTTWTIDLARHSASAVVDVGALKGAYEVNILSETPTAVQRDPKTGAVVVGLFARRKEIESPYFDVVQFVTMMTQSSIVAGADVPHRWASPKSGVTYRTLAGNVTERMESKVVSMDLWPVVLAEASTSAGVALTFPA